MNELLRNLDLILNKTTKPISENSNNSKPVYPQPADEQTHIIVGNLTNKPNVNKEKEQTSWSDTQVDSWLKEKNINETIVENLSPCNGQGFLFLKLIFF